MTRDPLHDHSLTTLTILLIGLPSLVVGSTPFLIAAIWAITAAHILDWGTELFLRWWYRENR